MSILIKGHSLPKDREHYLIQINADGTIYDAVGRGIVGVAVELPPHGRLIDADAVTNAAMEDILMWEDAGYDRDAYRAFLANYIEDAPTIIEAEEGKT